MSVPTWAKSLSLHESIDLLPVDEIRSKLEVYNHQCEINSLDLTGRTPLQCAISRRFVPIVKVLIEKDAKLDVKDVKGNTPIHYAVLGDDEKSLKILKMLIDKGADVNFSGEINQTPLHLAVKRNLESCVKLLLDNGANVNLQDSKGKTPLHYAILFRTKRILRLLIEREPLLDVKDDKGQSVLHLAALTNYVTGVSLLLNLGINVNEKDNLGNTPLHYSLYGSRKKQCNFKPFVELLINKNADIGQKNEEGLTPLHCAVIGNCFVEVVLLLKAGADVNVRDIFGRTPLHYSSMKRRTKTKIMKTLLDYGAKVNINDSSDKTPLHWAAKGCFLSRGALLIDYGADINAKDISLDSPLHLCVSQHSSFGKMLIEKGCELNFKNINGKTPLQIAVEEDFKSLSKILITKGAAINDKYQFGRSLLHLAVLNINVKIVKKLLQNNVNTDCKDENGQTALHYAAKCSYTSITLPRCKTIINLILMSGLYVSTKDKGGKTSLELSLEKAYYGFDIVQLLMEWTCICGPPDFTLHSILTHPPQNFSLSLSWAFIQVVNEVILKMKYCNVLSSETDSLPATVQMDYCLELKKINSTTIYCNTLGDIIYNYSKLAFLWNQGLKKLIFSSNLDVEFPLFSTILRAMFTRAKERLEIIPLVCRILNLPLPEEMVLKILSYVSDKDLYHIVKVTKPNITWSNLFFSGKHERD